MNAFLVLPDDKGVGFGIMPKDERLSFKFNAAEEK